MLKQISSALFISCISVAAYADHDSTFIVENKTNVDMMIKIQQLDSKQPEITEQLPAHITRKLNVVNGSIGTYYKTTTAPFELVAKDNIYKVYVHGRIAFYQSLEILHLYSFLDSVSAANGLNVDLSYSCKKNYSTNFQNKIVIEGSPESGLEVKNFPEKVTCQGLKTSSMDDKNYHYVPVCFDGNQSNFENTNVKVEDNQAVYDFSNGVETFAVILNTPTTPPNNSQLKIELDKQVGNQYCHSWV